MKDQDLEQLLWAAVQRRPITNQTVPAICARFGVSRATGYRWVPILEEARQRLQLMNIPRAECRRAPAAAGLVVEARAQ